MKTLENYKFETNTDPGENLLGFIQGQIRQYVIPDGFLDPEIKDNVIIYSAGPDNGSTMIGVITEELSFTIC